LRIVNKRNTFYIAKSVCYNIRKPEWVRRYKLAYLKGGVGRKLERELNFKLTGKLNYTHPQYSFIFFSVPRKPALAKIRLLDN